MAAVPAQTMGELLRTWRRRRGASQLELACDAEMNPRQLSMFETGRLQPSRQIILHLAACLEIPLGDRNALLAAAGYTPAFAARAFSEPALSMVRRSVETVLAAHDPNPALAVDRHWTLLAANRAVASLVAGAEPTLLRPPVNVLRLSLHPAGLASRIVNLTQWRAHVLAKLRRQIAVTDDPVLADLLDEIRDYPDASGGSVDGEQDPDMIAVPLRLATISGILSFFSTTTLFSASVDITVSGLAIEAFLPADDQTAEAMRRIAQPTEAQPGDWADAVDCQAGAMAV